MQGNEVAANQQGVLTMIKERYVLLGDEAIALAAIHSGITGAYSYPGTPATEILESIQRYARGVTDWTIHAKDWSANEKTAYETALGHSYGGCRTLVAFKHVGLNVAMDPFMSSASTGTNGGLVVSVADDPSMHSSQNEQDSRFLAEFAQIPCLDPWDQQTAYDWTREAFDISEELNLPVMVRIVTRLAHSRAAITTHEQRKPEPKPFCADWHDWTLIPSNARPNYERLLDKQPKILERLAKGPFFDLNEEGDPKFGVIATGLAVNYVREVYEHHGMQHPLLAIGAYPIPSELINRMFDLCDRILVVEEGQPLLERKLSAFGLNKYGNIHGRLTGELPRSGELDPAIVARALDIEEQPEAIVDESRYSFQNIIPIAGRPPQLCAGCSHIDVFGSLAEVMNGKDDQTRGRVFGDIGCYALGALPPYDVMETCVDMGASITMAIGAAHAGLHPSVAVIGDSTFTHSGLTGLVDAVSMDANILVVISDNSTVAMTGGQPDKISGADLIDVCISLGVDKEHVHFVDNVTQSNHEELVDIVRKEIEYDGTSVLICSRPCIHSARRDKSEKAAESKPRIDPGQDALVTCSMEGVGMPDEYAFKRELVLAGVGGQGILSIAQAISITAARSGMSVKQAETHGMSQRGGAVISHLRYSNQELYSDLVGKEEADVIISLEPMETLRWIEFLKPGGYIVANTQPVVNITNYPELDNILDRIGQYENHTLLDAEAIASGVGNKRAANMVLTGAAAVALGFEPKDWENTLRKLWSAKGERIVEGNIKAFNAGRNAGIFYRALIQAELKPRDASIIASKVTPSEESLEFVDAWAQSLNEEIGPLLIKHITAVRGSVSADPNIITRDMEPQSQS